MTKQLEVFKLAASQLTNLLQILGALVADYISNPTGPMDASLRPFVKNTLDWSALPSLKPAIATAVRGGDKLSALFEVGSELKDAMPDFRQNRQFTMPEIQMLRALRAYLSTDSENALNYIKKNAGIFGAPALAAVFAPEVPKADTNGLRKTVKSLVGRDGVHLTPQESEMLKETNPKQWERYATLRKQHNAEFKATLSNLVRKSGKDKIPYEQAYQTMVKMGFTHSMVPGFDGLIDDQGRWYTKDGELVNGVPNLSTYSHVVMNDKADPQSQWVCKAVKPDGGEAHIYTVNYRRDQSAAKYQNVQDLMQKMPQIQKAWRTQIMHAFDKQTKTFDFSSKRTVACIVLELLYTFAARIGSAPGRGLGTLLVKNASVTQAGVNLAYIGKDQIPTKHILRSADSPEMALMVIAIKQLMQNKKPSVLLFTAETGTRFIRVPPGAVNNAFHACGAPAEVTVHKLRTCRGTTLFGQLALKDEEKRRPPATQKDAMQRWKEMTEQVGKLLNHKRGVGTEKESVTGATAALSYIDGDLQLALWDRWGFRPPIALEKLLRGQDK